MRRALVIMVALILLVYLTSYYWLSAYGRFLVVNQTPHQSDAIVVLSGGETVCRVATGVDLYKRGYSSLIIMSGGGQLTSKLVDADLMQMEAADRGIPASSVLLEKQSKSTYENAVHVKKIIMDHKLKSLLLVTSNYHTRRAKFIFERVFKNTGVNITTISAPDREFNPSSWWKSHEGQQKALTELPNLIIYWIKY